MNAAKCVRNRERELEALNARAEASLTYDDEAWDDEVQAADDECASLRELLLASTTDGGE